MLRNTAGQTIGAQMLTAADGSAFTGAVVAYITGDGGSQAAGSVGSGACVHEGNGYHSYSPAQAETNYAHVAVTFVGTGAAPATVQVYTKTGDAYARLGAPVGASISADIAAVQSDTNDIQTRLPAALVSGRIDASVGAMAANVMTAAAAAADLTTELQTGLATAAALTTVGGNVTTILADTNDIQTRLPAALVSGRMDSSVGAMAADVLTAAATAADFGTEVRTGLATAAALATAQGDITSILADTAAVDARLPSDPADQSLVIAATDAVMARLGAPAGASISADIANIDAGGGATAAEIADEVQTRTIAAVTVVNGLAANTVTAAALAADAVVEIQSGLATSAGLGSLATSAALATVQSDTNDIQTRLPAALIGGLMPADIGAALTTPVTEAYADRGDEASIVQLLYMLWSVVAERRVVGDQLITGALDQSQAMTFLLDDVVSPTEQTRAS